MLSQAEEAGEEGEAAPMEVSAPSTSGAAADSPAPAANGEAATPGSEGTAKKVKKEKKVQIGLCSMAGTIALLLQSNACQPQAPACLVVSHTEPDRIDELRQGGQQLPDSFQVIHDVPHVASSGIVSSFAACKSPVVHLCWSSSFLAGSVGL